MNNKENLINTFISLTREKKINWKFGVLSSKITKYIANSDQISHIYCSDWKNNEIYFIVQKYIKYSHDIDIYFEQFTKFIHIFSKSELVYSIFEEEVSESMMDDLFSEVREAYENDFIIIW
jgi:hypothetical protein